MLRIKRPIVTSVILLSLAPSATLAAQNRCETNFRSNTIRAQYAAQVPLQPAVGPQKNLSIRDTILRFLSGIPFPQEAGRTMGTREMLDIWKHEQVPTSRWGASSPAILRSALHITGAFGPWGALGVRHSPVGIDPGSPWFWWRKAVQAGAWNTAPRHLFERGGPLNPDTGVLTQLGPDAQAWKQGVLDVFGTNSPLGPKGPLGVLGPMGAVMSLRAMSLDGTGVYIDQHTQEVVSSILMPSRPPGEGPVDLVKYDVFEDLSSKFTREISQAGLLDTSFMAVESLGRGENEKTYRVTARNSETVTALVVPDRGFMVGSSMWVPPQMLNFSLEVLTENGVSIVKSDMQDFANLLHFQVRAGEKYVIKVIRQGETIPNFLRPKPYDQEFRFVMTGSTSYYAKRLWEEQLGANFNEVMNMASDVDREIALNFIWAKLLHTAYSNFEYFRANPEMLKTVDTKNYWEKILGSSFDTWAALRTRNGTVAEFRTAQLSEMQRFIDEYRGIIQRANFTGEQVLALYVEMWGNGTQARESHFNMNVEQAARVPHEWLQMMEDNLAQLRAALAH